MRLSALGPSWKSARLRESQNILVESPIDARRHPLAERIVEDRISHRTVDAQLLRELAVDFDFQDPAGALLIARDVSQLRQRFELC
jgi:hypothetical protein